MNDCWYALALALLAKDYYTPEVAFEVLDKGPVKSTARTITDDDIKDMVILKETLTYKEIAEIYGMEIHAIYSRMRRRKIK